MVCDFIKDESGLWWFIGCRAFKVCGNNGRPTLRYFTLETHIMSDASDEEGDGKGDKKKIIDIISAGKGDYTKLRMCRFC